MAKFGSIIYCPIFALCHLPILVFHFVSFHRITIIDANAIQLVWFIFYINFAIFKSFPPFIIIIFNINKFGLIHHCCPYSFAFGAPLYNNPNHFIRRNIIDKCSTLFYRLGRKIIEWSASTIFFNCSGSMLYFIFDSHSRITSDYKAKWIISWCSMNKKTPDKIWVKTIRFDDFCCATKSWIGPTTGAHQCANQIQIISFQSIIILFNRIIHLWETFSG